MLNDQNIRTHCQVKINSKYVRFRVKVKTYAQVQRKAKNTPQLQSMAKETLSCLK